MRSILFSEAKESVKGLKYFAQRNDIRVNFTHGYIFFSTFLLVQYVSFCIASAKILFGLKNNSYCRSVIGKTVTVLRKSMKS